MTPPSSPFGLPVMASSPRMISALPCLIPDVGEWDTQTPSLLSFQLSRASDEEDEQNNKTATFLMDSLVTSVCIDHRVRKI